MDLSGGILLLTHMVSILSYQDTVTETALYYKTSVVDYFTVGDTFNNWDR
jgi:hypothetical protein